MCNMETNWKPNENIVSALDLWKTQRNKGLAFEHIENNMKAQVLRNNQMATQGEHLCCVRTNRKQNQNMFCARMYKTFKENTSVAWEPIENTMKTQVLRMNFMKRNENNALLGNQLRTQGKHKCCVGCYRKHKKHDCVRTIGKREENTGFALA